MNDNSHYTIYAYDSERKPLYKAKKGFLTEIEAVLRCFQINLAHHSIHKVVAYKCGKCGKWHIGHHNNIVLTEEERQKIRVKFERFKVINNIK
jgi:ribosomal protein L32